MGLHSNPLSYAGYPPDVTGTPTTQNASIRAATSTEAAAGTLENVYISPATAQFASALDFASPPVLGFGSTTPRPVHATTLSTTATSAVTLGEGSNLVLGTTTGTKIGTATTEKLGFFNATPVVQPIGTTDLRQALIDLGLYASGGATPLDLNGGDLIANSLTTTAPSVAGASPVVNNARQGQASFTDVIANGAYGTLTITNSVVTAASIIVAMASCTTANSAVQIVDCVPGVGSVAFRLLNAGSASTDVNININYWVLN